MLIITIITTVVSGIDLLTQQDSELAYYGIYKWFLFPFGENIRFSVRVKILSVAWT